MTAKIAAALLQLDPKNDNHWTADSLPRLEAVKLLASDQTLTRPQIEEAMPGFTRAGKIAVVADLPEKNDAASKVPEGSGVADEEAQPGKEEASSAEALERAKARLVAAAERKAAATEEHAQASAEVDVLIEALEKAGGVSTLADQLAGYFRGQELIRAERGRRISEMRGVSLKDILPVRAQIDQAMARRTAMGTKRPVKL